jgi:hypothetical protein
MMKIATKQISGVDVDILGERRGNAVVLSAPAVSHRTHTWVPHPRPGRTAAELQAELDTAVETFLVELTGHAETEAHLNALFPFKENS